MTEKQIQLWAIPIERQGSCQPFLIRSRPFPMQTNKTLENADSHLEALRSAAEAYLVNFIREHRLVLLPVHRVTVIKDFRLAQRLRGKILDGPPPTNWSVPLLLASKWASKYEMNNFLCSSVNVWNSLNSQLGVCGLFWFRFFSAAKQLPKCWHKTDA